MLKSRINIGVYLAFIVTRSLELLSGNLIQLSICILKYFYMFSIFHTDILSKLTIKTLLVLQYEKITAIIKCFT